MELNAVAIHLTVVINIMITQNVNKLLKKDFAQKEE
jgi:hypothetical protein